MPGHRSLHGLVIILWTLSRVPPDSNVLIHGQLTKKGSSKADPRCLSFLGTITPPSPLSFLALFLHSHTESSVCYRSPSYPQEKRSNEREVGGSINPAPSVPDCQDARIFSFPPSSGKNLKPSNTQLAAQVPLRVSPQGGKEAVPSNCDDGKRC